jgi:hypothetical protein
MPTPGAMPTAVDEDDIHEFAPCLWLKSGAGSLTWEIDAFSPNSVM